MRKAFAFLALLTAASLHAESSVHLTGFVAGVHSTGENQILDDPLPVDLVISSGAGFGGSADLSLGRTFAVELRVERLQPEVSLRAAGISLNAGSLDMTVSSFSLLGSFRAGERLEPYVGAGVVYATFSNIDAPVIGRFFDEELEVEPEFGASLAAGVRLRLSDRLSLVGDVRYFPVEIAIERSESFPLDVDLNPLVYSVGLRLKVR